MRTMVALSVLAWLCIIVRAGWAHRFNRRMMEFSPTLYVLGANEKLIVGWHLVAALAITVTAVTWP